MNKELPTDALLAHIKQRFYDPHSPPKRFFQDQRMLLYAITWPAAWLDQRALRIAPKRYESLLLQRLEDIVTHGDPARYTPCFPRYLLKSLQDWFTWHGEDLYDELKHIRNALPELETLLRYTHSHQNSEDIVAPMARAHAVLNSQYRRNKQTTHKQLSIF